MTRQNIDAWLHQAEQIARQLNSAEASVGKGYRSRTVRGVDVNELNKLCTILNVKKDPEHLNSLLNKLLTSQFCRTGRTQGYYRNILNVLNRNNFFNMDYSKAQFILGWVCRLMRYYK